MNDLFETLGNITKPMIDPMTDFYNFIDKVNEFDLLKNAEQLESQNSSEINELTYEEDDIDYYKLF
jgi:hypothetical protein